MRSFVLSISSAYLLCAGCLEPPPVSEEEISSTSQGVACRLYCDGNISRTSPGVGTSSLSCDTSTAGLHSFLEDYATNDCAALSYDVECGLNVVIVNACFPVGDSGSFQVNGYATYRCGRIDC